MTRRTARNVLMLVGTWYAALYLSHWLVIALIPINNRLVYEGDIGALIMHVWLAFPLAAMAAAAAVVWLRVSESPPKALWLAVLTCLFLYSGSSSITRGWIVPPRTIDRIGSIVEGLTPAAACLVVGLYTSRRMSKGIPLEQAD